MHQASWNSWRNRMVGLCTNTQKVKSYYDRTMSSAQLSSAQPNLQLYNKESVIIPRVLRSNECVMKESVACHYVGISALILVHSLCLHLKKNKH